MPEIEGLGFRVEGWRFTVDITIQTITRSTQLPFKWSLCRSIEP